MQRPRNRVALVNRALSETELESIRLCMARNRPYGGEAWQGETARRLGLEASLRPRGRPAKNTEK